MGKFALTWEKGRNTVDAETSLPNGFLAVCTGFMYLPDSLLLHKIPGVYAAHDLPSGATNANTAGLMAVKMRSHSYMLAATQSKISSAAFVTEGSTQEADDATGLPQPQFFTDAVDGFDTWVDLQDRQGTPVDFPFGGQFLKAIPDGRNRWIAWSGSESERALVLDEDMNARMLSMRQPNALIWPTPGDSASGLITNPVGATVTFRPDQDNTTFTSRTGASGDFTWMNKPTRLIPAGNIGGREVNPWQHCMPQTAYNGNADSDWSLFHFTSYFPIRTENGYYVTTFGDHSLIDPGPVRRQDLAGSGGSDDFARDVIAPYQYNAAPSENLTDPAAFSTDPENAYDGSTTTFTEKTNVGDVASALIELDFLDKVYDGAYARNFPAYTDRIGGGHYSQNPVTFDGVPDSVRAIRLVSVDTAWSGVGQNAPKAWWIRHAAEVTVYSVEYGFTVGHAQAGELTDEHLLVIDMAGIVNGGFGINPTDDNPTPWGDGPGAYKGSAVVEVSRDGNFGGVPTAAYHIAEGFPRDVGTMPRTIYAINLAEIPGILGTDEVVDLVIRISFYNDSPLNNSNSGLRIYDVKLQREDGAGAGNIPQGTFWYAHTEKLTKTLSDGTQINIESAPSEPQSIDVDADTYNGVKVFIPARQNVESMGVSNDAATGQSVTYKIYRSTKSGAWPDLGWIADMAAPSTPANTTFYTDTFESTPGEILGTPTINTVTSGSYTANAAGEAPPIRDATLYRGSLVVIPSNSPYELAWSMPGFADYFPNPSQRLKLLPSERNDELMGVLALNDVLVVFMQTRTVRLRELPFAGQSDYNLTRIERDVLSPNEGLAGTPLAYTTFELEDGRSMAAWVSHNGIWMTDGSLVTERGMGVVKLSRYMDWNNEVDVRRLSRSRLVYDPILQVLAFDFLDKDNIQRVVYFHTSPLHWLPTNKDQTVPKWTGPHPVEYNGHGRSMIERSGSLRHYFARDGNLYRMTRGDQAAGSDIVSFAETGWVYPGGPDKMFHLYDGTLEHTDWGKGEQGIIEVQVRNDESGSVQHAAIPDLPLGGGPRQSNFWINMAGQSMKMALRHKGKTTSLTTPLRAIKSIQADGELGSDNSEQ
jgi:hypothetical protein